jgi:hypothetical protein
MNMMRGALAFTLVSTLGLAILVVSDNIRRTTRNAHLDQHPPLAFDGAAEPEAQDTEYFFVEQMVDHFDTINNANRTWTQRYYMSDKYFGGPGSPIFIILGGGKFDNRK